MSKKKIFNDPVYGFIPVRSELIFDIIEHPYFQRLRRIRQLGLTDMVYPGALHTRFHHAIGAMHLMGKGLDSLRNKGTEISNQEYEAASIAILLHDVGHGPFSHTLEHSLMKEVKHESLSFLLMQYFNRHFNGALGLALDMFRGTYERTFFHQLISSQLDVDRLDYLRRDSFFTGVVEGAVSVERILKMLHVHKGKIVVEEKAMYSIEHFLNARRLMYWQVYLHKAAVSAEKMLINIVNRAKDLAQSGVPVFASPALAPFLNKHHNLDDFQNKPFIMDLFAQLDDYDIWGAVKTWKFHEDRILSLLSTMLLNRQLFKISLNNEPLKKADIKSYRKDIAEKYQLLRTDTRYFIAHGEVTNAAYVAEGQSIDILTKKGEVVDIVAASDLPNIKAMSKIVKKYYLCRPKNVSL